MILELYTDIKQALLFRVCLFVCTIQIYDQGTLFSDLTFSRLLLFLAVCLVEVVSLFSAPAPQRPAVEQKELTNKWNEMGTDEPGLETLPRGLAPKRSAFYERLLLMCVNAGASFRRWRINTSLIQIYHFHVCFLNWYLSRGGSLRDLRVWLGNIWLVFSVFSRLKRMFKVHFEEECIQNIRISFLKISTLYRITCFALKTLAISVHSVVHWQRILCPNNAITAQWRTLTFRMCRPPAINTLDCEYRSCPGSYDRAAITSSTPPSVQNLNVPSFCGWHRTWIYCRVIKAVDEVPLEAFCWSFLTFAEGANSGCVTDEVYSSSSWWDWLYGWIHLCSLGFPAVKSVLKLHM